MSARPLSPVQFRRWDSWHCSGCRSFPGGMTVPRRDFRGAVIPGSHHGVSIETGDLPTPRVPGTTASAASQARCPGSFYMHSRVVFGQFYKTGGIDALLWRLSYEAPAINRTGSPRRSGALSSRTLYTSAGRGSQAVSVRLRAVWTLLWISPAGGVEDHQA